MEQLVKYELVYRWDNITMSVLIVLLIWENASKKAWNWELSNGLEKNYVHGRERGRKEGRNCTETEELMKEKANVVKC